MKHTPSSRTAFTLLLASAFLTACTTTGSPYQRPDVESPAAFAGQNAAEITPVSAQWWKNFRSPELDGLMVHALEQNNDVRASVFRIEQARANLKIAGAAVLPTVSATAGATRDYQRNPTDSGTRLSLGADINYELDLFGRNRAGVDVSRANLQASEFDRDALNLIVMADVARGYFTVMSLRERLSIADENLGNAREVLRIIQARFDAGSVSALDLAQQKSTVASRDASRATIEKQVANAENALAVLSGQPPRTLTIAGGRLADLDVPHIVAGQPSSLLERRPDIRAAEAGLVAANANIAAARAALYPSVTLGTNWSAAAVGLGDPATSALALVAQLAVPIFQGGRIEGGIELATARQGELAENYRKAVLVSFQEVEDALAGLKAAHAREESLGVALAEARKAYELSRRQFDAGAIDFQRLLDTQDTLLSAQDGHAQTRLERLSAAVDLYKALGGGWQ